MHLRPLALGAALALGSATALAAQAPEPRMRLNQLGSLSRPPRIDRMMFITLEARSR